jgi:hypothetical protein
MKETDVEFAGSEALTTADRRSDASTRTYDALPLIVTLALLKARERGFAPGYESEDRIKAEAEILGHTYSLTGAGS